MPMPSICRLPPVSCQTGEDDACGIGQEHHAEDPCREPASARVEPEGEDHRHGQNQDRPAFEDVGEGVGVFERVRRVGSEVAAAVGSQLFDGHDGCGGALRDDLLGAFERRERLLAVEGHRRAVDDEQDADGERQGIRMRVTLRVRKTQKLPMVRRFCPPAPSSFRPWRPCRRRR